MARTNFTGKKREKEMNRKRKQEQKRQDKLDKKNLNPDEQPEQPSVDIEGD